MTKQLIDLVLEEIKPRVTLEEYIEVASVLRSHDKVRDAKLDALEQVGVSNWEGYEEAQKLMEEWGY